MSMGAPMLLDSVLHHVRFPEGMPGGALTVVFPTMTYAQVQGVIAGGGLILLAEGTFTLGSNSYYPPSGTTIRGVPGKTILQKTSTTGIGATKPHIDIDDVTDVTIEGITFEQDATTTRENAIMVRSTGADLTKRIHIKNCVIYNSAVSIQRWVDGFSVTGCYFYCSISGGTQIASVGLALGGDVDRTTGVQANSDGPVKNGLIQFCYFENARSEAIDFNWDVQDVTADSCVIVDCDSQGPGEQLDIGGGVCKNITISNCHIRNTVVDRVTNGIEIKQGTGGGPGSENIVVKGCTFENAYTGSTTCTAIRVSASSGVTVIGNTIKGWTNAVTIYNGSSIVAVNDNTMKNQTIYGVQVNVATEVTIANNVIKAASATQRGVDVQSCTDFAISGNTVEGFGNAGIYVRSTATDGAISTNVVRGGGSNSGIRSDGARVVTNGNTVSGCAGSGLTFAAVRQTVTNNQAYDNGTTSGYGFNFAAGCDYAVVTGNSGYDTRAGGSRTQVYGISFAASDRVKYDNNHFYNNLTANENGTGTLTNSHVGVAGNLAA